MTCEELLRALLRGYGPVEEANCGLVAQPVMQFPVHFPVQFSQHLEKFHCYRASAMGDGVQGGTQ